VFNNEVDLVLENIGLKSSEVKVYRSLLANPAGLHIQEVTNQTGIKRSSVNLILGRLVQKGFVTFHTEEAWKVFSAENPTKILYQLQDMVESFQGIVPFLTAAQFGGKRTRIKFFEGKDTINKIHRDILLSTKYLEGKKEMWAFSSGKDIYQSDPESVEWFVKGRIKNDLFLKWIAPEDEFTKTRFLRSAQSELREIKFFNQKKYPFHIQVNIYANSVALISLKGNISGAIIENSLIADSFKALFNLLWDKL
jgi:predicted DNA-binding transcriptional regulator